MERVWQKPYVIDIAADLIDADKEMRRFPTAQAWAGTGSLEMSVDETPIPANAIDIVFIHDKSSRGDRETAAAKEAQERERSRGDC
jgi:hypothetical protein